VANALSDSLTQALEAGRPQRLLPLFERSVQDERLFATGVCRPDGRMLTDAGRWRLRARVEARVRRFGES
jgi:hypothetical protein